MMPELFVHAQACLRADSVAEKLELTAAAGDMLGDPMLLLDEGVPVATVTTPGRPPRPRLVAPRDLPRRSLGSAQGHAALIHAVAHIEFNAIDLAWDAVQRFRGLPRQYYLDWAGVAVEEGRHFHLIHEHLRGLGYCYGDFEAHDGLWEMALKTAGDVLLRMALVPRLLEARGLDASPGMIRRLREAGDGAGAEILSVILHDEIGHVATGDRWFRYLCARRGHDPEPYFHALLNREGLLPRPGSLNRQARLQAGFSASELERLG